MSVTFFTPPQLAKQSGVEPEKIIQWIRSGELRAVNFATHRGGRPRFRIDAADWQRFLESRSTVPAPKPARNKKSQFKRKYFV